MKKITILGANGCIGRKLVQELVDLEYEIIASGKGIFAQSGLHVNEHLTYRELDMSDKESIKESLGKSEVVIYLIHSLDKKDFLKLDVEYANNLVDAIAESNVKKIIYMGGLADESESLSHHLTSRIQTGSKLSEANVNLAEIRSAIVIDKYSSSFNIVKSIAKSFPVLPIPTYANHYCSPVCINDVVNFITSLIDYEINGHEIFELGGDTYSYKEFLRITRKELYGKKMRFLKVPLFLYNEKFVSKIIEQITHQNFTLIYSLICGLKNNTNERNCRYEEITKKKITPLEIAIQNAR